jgi:pyrroline-5-carboxylate reductase
MNICFIGGGNMATALIGGLLKRGHSAFKFYVVEIDSDRCKHLHNDFGVHATTDLAAGIAHGDYVVLAVKPQQLRTVTMDMAPLLSGQLVISIAAGVRAKDLARWTGTQNIVRAMPNTPALIRCGMTGLYALPAVSEEHRNVAQSILAAVGDTIWLDDEEMMDAVTAVSGSGPAYVFYFIEAMQQAASDLGFSEEDSRRLVLHTFSGAAKLASVSEDKVDKLRERVTSKGGTTESALLNMDAHDVKRHIISAVQAAAARAREMGDELGGD